MNAFSFDPDGARVGAFVLDDAIGQVACTPGGMIWVGYFDERMNESALVAFDLEGRRVRAVHIDPYVLDCYALSVTGEEAWACTYPDFPIVRDAAGQATFWENDVCGAQAIAAKGNHVILSGGYQADRDRVTLLSLGDGRADLVSEFRWPAIVDRSVFVRGRDGVLHAVADGRWWRIAVDDWLASLG